MERLTKIELKAKMPLDSPTDKKEAERGRTHTACLPASTAHLSIRASANVPTYRPSVVRRGRRSAGRRDRDKAEAHAKKGYIHQSIAA
jgi:hypothetical protein